MYLILLTTRFTKHSQLQFINTLFIRLRITFHRLMRLYINVHVTAKDNNGLNRFDKYIFFLPGVVQKSTGEMAQKGEEQPSEYAGTRKK